MGARDLAQKNAEQKLKAHSATGESQMLYQQAMQEADPDRQFALFQQAREKNSDAMDILKSLPLAKPEVRLAMVEAMGNATLIHERILHSKSAQVNATQVPALNAMAAACLAEPGSAPSRPFDQGELEDLNLHVQTLNEAIVMTHQLADIYRSLLTEQPYALHLPAGEKKEFETGRQLNLTRQSLWRMSAAHLKTEMALQQRLRNLSAPAKDDDMLLLRHFASNYDSRFYVLLGNLNGVISPLNKESSPTGEQRTEVLQSLAAQFGTLAHVSEWVASVSKTDGADDRDIVADIRTLADCATEVQKVAQDQLAQPNQLNEQRDADASASFLPPGLDIQGGSKRQARKKNRQDNTQQMKQQTKRQGIQQAEAKQPAENPHATVIDTEFDGKLVGERKGDFVEVANFRGGTIPYRRQGEVWVRHEPEDDLPLSSETARNDGRLPPEKTMLALHVRQAKVGNKADAYLEEGRKYQRLASYMDRNGASYKQVNYTIRLALNKLSAAENPLRQLAAAWTRLGGQHKDIRDTCAREAQVSTARAHDLDVQRREMTAAQIAAVKQQLFSGDKLDGDRLHFLLSEGEVGEVRTSIHRKKLAGAKIKARTAVPEDYMDEHKIFLKGDSQALTLHTHYRKRDAPLEQQQSSHLQYTGADGVQRNGPDIALVILQRLHGGTAASR